MHVMHFLNVLSRQWINQSLLLLRVWRRNFYLFFFCLGFSHLNLCSPWDDRFLNFCMCGNVNQHCIELNPVQLVQFKAHPFQVDLLTHSQLYVASESCPLKCSSCLNGLLDFYFYFCNYEGNGTDKYHALEKKESFMPSGWIHLY